MLIVDIILLLVVYVYCLVYALEQMITTADQQSSQCVELADCWSSLICPSPAYLVTSVATGMWARHHLWTIA